MLIQKKNSMNRSLSKSKLNASISSIPSSRGSNCKSKKKNNFWDNLDRSRDKISLKKSVNRNEKDLSISDKFEVKNKNTKACQIARELKLLKIKERKLQDMFMQELKFDAL